MKEIYLAGGCFWGTEHYFKQIISMLPMNIIRTTWTRILRATVTCHRLSLILPDKPEKIETD
jgi:hypothetical protein